MAKPRATSGDDHPGPLATVQDEAADQPVHGHDGDQISEDHLQHEIRAGDADARGLLEQVATEGREPRQVVPIGDPERGDLGLDGGILLGAGQAARARLVFGSSLAWGALGNRPAASS